jgi:succinate-semialdehyde dehydrogenase/glutarate-semialdehyde dehydrogenase
MIASINPATGETLRTFDPMTDTQVDDALALAESAWRSYRHTPLAGRARWLSAAANILEEEKDRLGRIMTLEMGKPIGAARAEAVKCASACRYYAEHGERLLADKPLDAGPGASYLKFQSIGPVLAVMPWNYPFWQVFRFAAPALMAGNVGLLKHAPSVPRTALLLEDLFRRAGAPDGVFQTLLIGTDQVSAVIADPRVAAVTLTGSVGAGRAVAAQAGAVGKKIVLELGGSDPFIVLPSADLEQAIAVGVQARVQNAGQSCIAAKRFIVHQAVARQFIDGFVAGMEALSVGDPFDPATEVGPLVTAEAVDKIAAQVEDARAHGASILCGGERVVGPEGPDRPGNFYRPTVITDITPDMRVATEEVFGPVALLYTVADADEALALANHSEFGLGSSVWTTDADEQQQFVSGLQAGQVFVNGMVVSMVELPFGGIKSSGVGRELSTHGIQEFCNIKSVWVA